MTQDMDKESILQMWSDKIISRYVYDKSFTIRFPDRSEWKEGFQLYRKGRLIWYTDGFKIRKKALELEHWTIHKSMQAEVYAIKACAVENLDTECKIRNIYILSERQATIKALGQHQITSKLVWNCHQSLIQLARHNRVQLIWVPGNKGISGNKTVDPLARTVSEHLFTRLEPVCGISIGVAKRAVRSWANRNHQKQWESTTGLKQAKGLILGPAARRTKDLLKLNRG
jgi:hypothetical protein